MSVEDFLTLHEAKTNSPLNVIDFKLAKLLAGNVADEYGIPDIIRDNTLEEAVQKHLPDARARSPHTVLILSEAGARTRAHVDYTATSVMYIMLEGEKKFEVLEPCQEDRVRLAKWDRNRHS